MSPTPGGTTTVLCGSQDPFRGPGSTTTGGCSALPKIAKVWELLKG